MVTDFTRVDPHLGTNEDLVDLVEAAHSRGMKIFLDVTANHTADVITYAGAGPWPAYRTKETYPYTDVNGDPFDDAAVAGSDDFPELGPDSFPYQPVVPADQADGEGPRVAQRRDDVPQPGRTPSSRGRAGRTVTGPGWTTCSPSGRRSPTG